VLALGLDEPGAFAVVGQDLFVANLFVGYGPLGTGSVTELNTTTRALVRVISGAAYDFDGTDTIAAAGDDLFVPNEDGNSLTEVSASTGALVRIFRGPAYGFEGPFAMAVGGDDLFVANVTGGASFSGSLTEINTTTGALVRVISSSADQFVVRVVSGLAYNFDHPVGLAVAGGDLFVANGSGNSLTELNASTGALVRVFSRPLYRFAFPSALVVVGNDLFVANEDGTTVTELPI
jgi:outer membrane protein assembly factor BamB